MKKLLILSALIIVQLASLAQKNVRGTQIGPAITNVDIMDVSNLVELMTDTDELADVKLRGTVVDVCKVKGCWMKLENPKGEAVHIMFKDYALFMPKDLAGKSVVLEGKSYLSVTPVEELRHYAEDAGKSKAEIEKITEPKREIRVEAWAVTIITE